MLEVVNLSCARGDRPLFRDLSFRLAPGQLLHVQGPNGSGKTTLLRTLCGLSQPVAGEIRWQGGATQADRETFNSAFHYLGHLNALHGDLSGEENLRYQRCLSGAGGDPGAILKNIGMSRPAGLPTKLLSQGQKRRMALARLALEPRPLWILDEPFTALDVRAVRALLDRFATHLAGGGLIILTSHQEVALADWPVLTLGLEG